MNTKETNHTSTAYSDGVGSLDGYGQRMLAGLTIYYWELIPTFSVGFPNFDFGSVRFMGGGKWF